MRLGWISISDGALIYSVRFRALMLDSTSEHNKSMKSFLFGSAVVLAAVAVMAPATDRSRADSRLANAHREAVRAGWVEVHLSGSPREIGYQHGFLLAPEIKDNYDAIRLSMTHDSRDWNF